MKKEKRLAIKLFISLIYLIVITMLFVGSFYLFREKKKIYPFREVETVDKYSYIDIDKMSEKFAFYESTNVGLHFVIETEDTGLWRTYIIAINEEDYDKYKKMIDYTYERTEEVPEKIRVYGYPVVIDGEIKDLVIKNIPNFVPKENEVVITEKNYEQYLTNSYLDTTKEQKNEFSIILCVSLFLLLAIIVLFFMTLFDKDKLVNTIDEKTSKKGRNLL